MKHIHCKISIFNALGFHHVVIIILVLIATITAILLAGSGSNAIGHRVYLVQLSYLKSEEPPDIPFGAWENISIPAFEAVRHSQLRVRLGYFGLCAAQDDDFWICRRSVSGLMAGHRFVDPLGMASMADKLKSDVIFPGLLIGSGGLALISIVLFSLFPGWHKEMDTETGSDIDVKPFPGRTLVMSCLAVASLATLFALTSTLWQHTASATAATILENSAFSVIKASVGPVATALAWLLFALWLVVFTMAFLIFSSITILDRLTDSK